MIYTVLKLEEDLDYGVREKGEEQPVMAVVTLRSEAGEGKHPENSGPAPL